jgi:hypothetical protein
VIVRILGEGQVEVPDGELVGLNELDATLLKAVDSKDEKAFRDALSALLGRVREVGSRLPDDVLKPSDLVLPSADASVEDVRELLSDEGLIPG